MQLRSRTRRSTLALLASIMAILFLFSVGCSPEPEFRFNAVRLRAIEKIELEKDEHYDEIHHRDIGNLMTAMFGTPDEPHFPMIGEDYASIVDLENLKIAAGPVSSDREGNPRGLYREHCASCHGVSGDGIGPSAAILNPYPRDFRLGKYKFKQTRVNTPPRDHDLERIIRNGIPGTPMPSFRTLSDEEVAALVDYVKYLTIRGQVERGLIKMLADLGDTERLIDIKYADGAEMKFLDRAKRKAVANGNDDLVETQDLTADELKEQRLDQLDLVIGDVLFDIFDAWLDAQEAAIEIPAAPNSFQVNAADHHELVKLGRDLFFGKANCVQCHGNTGLGDGGQINYDDWTTDWTKDTGVNLQIQDSYREFLDLGALQPRQLRPRNLRLGVFRGGDRPKDIFHRVSEGIEGTPMPATLTLSDTEKWALVAYVMNLPYEKDSDTASPTNK